MTSLFTILLFSIATLVLSMGVGYLYGRQRSKDERAATMKALLMLLSKTEEITTDVDSRNAELEDVGRSVEKLKASGPMVEVQKKLLEQITVVIQSNRKLEDDLVCAHYMLEEQAQELDRTRCVARTDPLSGIANRLSFDETLSYWLSLSKRKSKRFTLALGDVDHFKWINDTHGHLAGDRVVTHIGNVLREQVRGLDYVARIGGDEFALLLAQADPGKAVDIADRIRKAISSTTFNVGLNSERVAVTLSMGVALSAKDDSSETLLQRADEAMYISKQAGRNCLNWEGQKAEPAEPAEAGV